MLNPPHTKVTVTLPQPLLERLDIMVSAGAFPSRSALLEQAVQQFLRTQMDALIETEAAKLDRPSEQAEAEEGWEDFGQLQPKPRRA